MIEAVIFDWAGTTIDYGCFAPVQAFSEAFSHFRVPVTMEETRVPMGMLKKEHIRTMLQMERIAEAWEREYGRPSNETDVEALYSLFEPKLFSVLNSCCGLKPWVTDTMEALRSMDVKIGSTTGYTDSMMSIVLPLAASQGYSPDFWITPDSVEKKGRPFPYMIFRNLQALQVSSVKNALKVGDTAADIREGKNAGIWTAGVLEGSSEIGLSQEEFESLPPQEQGNRLEQAEQNFRRAGTDFVIRNLSELPKLVQFLGSRQ